VLYSCNNARRDSTGEPSGRLVRINLPSSNFVDGGHFSAPCSNRGHWLPSYVWNHGKCITGEFCHLTKAFDCVRNKLLFKKLECYGVRSVLLNWFRSYLDDRKQRFYLQLL
jgi:hypothetical protein